MADGALMRVASDSIEVVREDFSSGIVPLVRPEGLRGASVPRWRERNPRQHNSTG